MEVALKLQSNNMKKKVLIISGIVVTILVVVLLVIILNKTSYKIIVSLVDDQSPDRILTVYNNKNEKMDVKRVEYLDGTLLCYGHNMAVHYGDIENVKELRVVLKDKSIVTAEIVKEEVKK